MTAPSVSRVAGPVERGELNVTGRHQVLRDNHRLGVGRHSHVVIDLQGDGGVLGPRRDRPMVPTFTPAIRTSSPG